MKIAQIASIAERVPAKKYGGSERIVYTLTEELVKRGHEVTLFATGDSLTSAKLSSIIPYSLRELAVANPYGLNELTFTHFAKAYSRAHEFDIIHDHIYAISMPTANLSKTPVVSTVHSMFHDDNIPLYQATNNVHLVSISKSQIPHDIPDLNIAGTVYHGLYMNHYPFTQKPDNYLLFVGRMSMEKGVHYAIEAAQKLNMPLKIVARIADYELDYFNTYVKPKLHDERIELIGELGEEERNQLMTKAIAVLHPVTWPEPFGLTMIESMACGTPVVAFNQGSIPEVIKEGVSGNVVNDVDEMVEAVKNIGRIDRNGCREYALTQFCAERMADAYEKIYRDILTNKVRKVQIPTTDQAQLQPIRNFTISPEIL